jgi:hypothetical protein
VTAGARGPSAAPTTGRTILVLALVGAVAVALIVVLVVVISSGNSGQQPDAQAAGTATAAAPAAATSTGAASPPPGLLVERLAVFPPGSATSGPGVDVLPAGSKPTICYAVPNAAQALLKVVVRSGSGSVVGGFEGAAPPNGSRCAEVTIEGQLPAGTYTVQLLDATNKLLTEKQFRAQ